MRTFSLTCLPIDYDLVRIYHPDSIIARRYPPEVAQERIQAINKAYDTLRGRAVSSDEPISATPGYRMDSAWLKPRSSRRPYFDDVAGDDRWTERTIVLIAVFTLVAFVAQTSFTRLQVLKSWTPRQAGSAATKHAQSENLLAEASMQDERS
ncbi:hypothetical protein SCLCIDRAFT_1208250 [Scleroderma citrinum Foug A]|uniref:J domain-containing protein n=1 Tax=Scleroderma citrinum Foug A TaxID=1036808 RepID=A0A0C3ENI0_9AGAM|nr:hypothetical protein SCLCIDRAFT_1208250 [Scleroderma citrinum Foug A]